MLTRTNSLAGLFVLAVILGPRVRAEPYLAVRQGLKCTVCHVNPTGGGLRSEFGDAFAQNVLPMKPDSPDWGLWTGDVAKFLRVGGDVRYDATVTQVPKTKTVDQFQLQQGRLYLEGELIPGRLLVYADEQIAPGGAVNHEIWAMYWSADHDWYIKAGQMYLPFGFRFEDQTAFVYDVSSITMYSPDDGLEFGWLRGPWDAQVTVSNGTFAGSASGQGKEYGLQLSFVESRWRLGLAVNDDDAAEARRKVYGLFGGLRTGPVVWLAQADMVKNEFGSLAGTTQAAGLFEGDWLIHRGNNLKFTMELFDPNRDVHGNGESRWSLVYELTPVRFVQLRVGVRDYDGPSGVNADHTKLYFVQLHGFF